MMKPRASVYVLELLNSSVRTEHEENLYKMEVFEEKKIPAEKKVNESKAHNPSACHLWMCWVRKQEKPTA